MSTTKLITFLILVLLKQCTISQPSKICFIGDNLYGDVVKPFGDNHDPRTLMGTFTITSIQSSSSQLSIDFTSPIYKHTNHGENESNYIFKISNIGWVLSENASPDTVTTDNIKLTCFEDNIVDCLKYRWFWGYNSNQYPIFPVAITIGECNTDICMDNFIMIIKSINAENQTILSSSTLDGFMTAVSPNEPCQTDTNVCESNRTYWINQDDTAYRWYHRLTKNANWVYGRSGSDRIACAPGYVESPLFCTTFVYASDSGGMNYTNYTFKSGPCIPTPSPTIQPTISPTSIPTISPTKSPTDIPKCGKQYVFDAIEENTNITINCPFGYIGTNIVRECKNGAIWNTISDDCHLISFTDDFSYFRDELWMNDNNESSMIGIDEYEFIGSQNIDLHSYTSFNYPLRIDFSGYIDGSTNCGGYRMDLINKNSKNIDISAQWDCNNRILSVGNISDNETNVNLPSSSTKYVINGYFLYRRDYNGDINALLQDNKNGAITKIINSEWLSSSQQLLISSLTNDNKKFIFTEISLTTFVDWFNPPKDTNNLFSSLWTTTPTNNFLFGQYTSNSFLDIDPDSNRTYIELSNGESISSDDTQFQFISPFSMSMIFNTMDTNNTIDTDTTVEIISSTAIKIAFRIDSDNLYITLDGTPYSTSYSDCSNETELYTKMNVHEYNASISVYDSNMDQCGILSSPATLSSLLNWNSLTIKPTTNTDIASISYFHAISGVPEEIITNSPSNMPTKSPTPTLSECIDPLNATNIYSENEEFSIPCNYGLRGTSDKYKCLSDGTYKITKGCFNISIGDDFLWFNKDIWNVFEPSYVNGRVAINDNDNGIQFIPNNPALVTVIKSINPIVYPLKLRSTVIKNDGECNNWFIALGDSYLPRSANSILLKYDCITHEASLFNSSYKRYDMNCWDDDNQPNGTLDVTITSKNSRVTASFDTLDCADLIVQSTDIKSNAITPYIWFGSFNDDSNNDQNVVARFLNIFYTQFYSEFDGFNQLIWSNSPNIEDNTATMTVGDEIIAGNSYQFKIPFMVQMGIKRPFDKTMEESEPEINIQGRYAHFIVFGATTYMNKTRNNVIQIVYDGLPRARIVYTSYGIYVNSTGCKWGVYGKTFDVEIQIDANIISISDDFCDTILYAKHDLNVSAQNQTLMAMGMVQISDYTVDLDYIAFDYIEVYQQPQIYYNELLNADEITLSDTSTVSAIYGKPKDDSIKFLGIDLIYWIIGGAILLVLLCLTYCLSAWCLNCFPFGKSTKGGQKKVKYQHGKKMSSNSPISPIEPTKATTYASHHSHDRFESGHYKDEEFPDTADTKNKNIVEAEHDDDDDDDDEKQQAMMNNNNTNNSNKIRMSDAQLQQQNMMIQRQLFLQRQFIEMMMNNPQQQATLMSMQPLQRKQYIQQQMMLYVNAMNQNLQQIPPQLLQQQMMMMNTTNTMQNNGEGGGGNNNGGFEGTGNMTGSMMNMYGMGMNTMNTNSMINMNMMNAPGQNGPGQHMMNAQHHQAGSSQHIINQMGGVNNNNNNNMNNMNNNSNMNMRSNMNVHNNMNMHNNMNNNSNMNLHNNNNNNINNNNNNNNSNYNPAMIRLANANQQHSMPNNMGNQFGINGIDPNQNAFQLPPQPQLPSNIEMQAMDPMSFQSDDNPMQYNNNNNNNDQYNYNNDQYQE